MVACSETPPAGFMPSSDAAQYGESSSEESGKNVAALLPGRKKGRRLWREFHMIARAVSKGFESVRPCATPAAVP